MFITRKVVFPYIYYDDIKAWNELWLRKKKKKKNWNIVRQNVTEIFSQQHLDHFLHKTRIVKNQEISQVSFPLFQI